MGLFRRDKDLLARQREEMDARAVAGTAPAVPPPGEAAKPRVEDGGWSGSWSWSGTLPGSFGALMRWLFGFGKPPSSSQGPAPGRELMAPSDVVFAFLEEGLSPNEARAWMRAPQERLEGKTPAQWLADGGDRAALAKAARRSAAAISDAG